MKCPLLLINRVILDAPGKRLIGDCLKEECAWWDNTNGMCAILQLSKSIYYAGLYLPKIEENMPHWKDIKRRE